MTVSVQLLMQCTLEWHTAMYLGVAAEMVQSPRANLKVFEQCLYVVAVCTEHVIQHWHSSLDECIHKLTTILRHTHIQLHAHTQCTYTYSVHTSA